MYKEHLFEYNLVLAIFSLNYKKQFPDGKYP